MVLDLAIGQISGSLLIETVLVLAIGQISGRLYIETVLVLAIGRFHLNKHTKHK